MGTRLRGYWVMTWLGLIANVAAIPFIALLAFGGPPLQATNISLAFSLAWPASVVGIVASSGLLAQRRWGVVLAIVALSMSLSVALPYGIVRLVIVKDPFSTSGISLLISIINLLALIYWCRPQHRRLGRL